MTEKEKIELAELILKRNGYTDKEIADILLDVFGDKEPNSDAD